MPSQSAPALVRLYAAGAALLEPLAFARVRSRLRAHGTPPERHAERLGHATQPRPQGPLLWFHAASVGESLSVLRLITHLGEIRPSLNFLLTSGTPASADVLAGRMPPRTIHQFAPLDSRRAVMRFLHHWQPDAGVFVESELWPNMLRFSARAGIPLALLNARISDRSARNWKRFSGVARHLLRHFRMIHCQDTRTAAHLQDLGLRHATAGQNLKAASGPLPFDAAALHILRERLAGRPVWVASSTHDGEEDIVLDAHRRLLAHHPDLLLILVPRHPDRGDAVSRRIGVLGLAFTRRTSGQAPCRDAAVYLADTLGETGLWYALSPIVCLGGSFTPVGGHNPYEPAHAGAAVLHGPLHANFTHAYADFARAGGALEVADATALAAQVDRLLADPQQLELLCGRSAAFAAQQEHMLDTLGQQLLAHLELADDG